MEGGYKEQVGGDPGEQMSGQHQSQPHVQVHTGRNHRVQVKIAIPFKEHPNFNFVGKLLGPKGSALKQLQEMTQTRMAILGRGSMRDKKKEDELRNNGEVKYSHLNEELHVEVSAFAPPAEAYRRIAHAMDELARYLVPDYSDGMGGQYPMQDMSMNGGPRGPKPPMAPQGYGYEDPSGPRPPPPGPPAGRGGGAGFWASAPPARGGMAPRRGMQRGGPGGVGGARRPPAPAAAPDYSYEEPYGRYEAGAPSTDYYAEQGMEDDVNFAADDYSAEPPRAAAGGPTRSFPPRARAHPYGSGARPY